MRESLLRAAMQTTDGQTQSCEQHTEAGVAAIASLDVCVGYSRDSVGEYSVPAVCAVCGP